MNLLESCRQFEGFADSLILDFSFNPLNAFDCPTGFAVINDQYKIKDYLLNHMDAAFVFANVADVSALDFAKACRGCSARWFTFDENLAEVNINKFIHTTSAVVGALVYPKRDREYVRGSLTVFLPTIGNDTLART